MNGQPGDAHERPQGSRRLDGARLEELADRLWSAFIAREPVEPLTDSYPDLTLGEAYAIQLRNAARRLARGARRVGYKVGVTSAEAQAQFGVTQPDFGHLFEDMVDADGATIQVSRFIRPWLEVEVGLILSRPLVGPGVTPEQVCQAVEWVAPCFELIDSRIRAWGGGIADSVADNAFSAGVVVSEHRTPLSEVVFERLSVTVSADDREIGRVSPGTGPRDPIAVVAWLANTLSSHGLALEAGQLVLSGSLLPPLMIRPGLKVRAEMEALGDVAVMFAEGEIR